MGAGPACREELPRGPLSVRASEPVSVGVGGAQSFLHQRVVVVSASAGVVEVLSLRHFTGE